MSGILVYVETPDGAVDRLSAETLGFAADLASRSGGALEAVVVAGGEDRAGAQSVAAGLGGYGVSKVHLVTGERLDAYAPAAWASGVEAVMASGSFDAVIAPGSDRASEIMALASARTGQPMAANVTSAEPGTPWRITRQRWAGSLLEDATLDGAPRFITVAPHAVAAMEPGSTTAAEVTEVTAPVSDADLRARVVGRDVAAAAGVSLSDAKVVIGGGRGIGSGEAFAMLDELAGLLGAAVGVSRVVTSLGWRPHTQQIGQTGTRIAPDLYIACGISGAIQHIVGAKAAKRILVINTDPEAPIFRRANYAVIGDVHAVVPAITAEVRRAKGAG
ncbi:MAG TPA: electron transfer flavoprotein subunit alpha/FixB family protein [Candidatus Limnocylindrales bacterium]|nr:electron transfer flavoprotein subunit alpha/FixB family protein [Candidatus Limnocylindrales bacterium]